MPPATMGRWLPGSFSARCSARGTLSSPPVDQVSEAEANNKVDATDAPPLRPPDATRVGVAGAAAGRVSQHSNPIADNMRCHFRNH